MILDYERYRFKTSKKGKKRLIFLFLIIILIAATIILFFILKIPEHINFNFFGIQNKQEDLNSLWENRLYDEIITICDNNLKNNPLDPNYNIFRGFSYFYKAYAETSFESRTTLLNESLISLRRALLIDNKQKSQLYYMLGKVYFHKDKYYFDLCIKYLNKSLESGYIGQDTYEYLAIAYDKMGKPQTAIEYFLMAYEQRPLDIYLYFVAKKYTASKNYEDAEEYLIRILNKTNDKELIIECLFELGNIYFKIGEYLKAEQLYNKVFEYDNNSAEAYYHIALVYKKYWELYKKADHYAKCRAYLRKALEKNPKHKGVQNLLDELNGGI